MEFRDAVARWDKRYQDAEGFLFGEAPNSWLVEQARWLDQHAAAVRSQGRAPQVLAVADGEARNGVWLARRGWRVQSFDCSEVALAKARAYAAREKVDIQMSRADLAEWPWPAQRWDAIVAIYFQFASPALRDRTLKLMVSSLKPGGLLIIEGYGPRQIEYRTGGPGILEHLYTSALLQEHFRDLEVLAWRDADIQLNEGTGHVGLSHVVSAAVRKPLT